MQSMLATKSSSFFWRNYKRIFARIISKRVEFGMFKVAKFLEVTKLKHKRYNIIAKSQVVVL